MPKIMVAALICITLLSACATITKTSDKFEFTPVTTIPTGIQHPGKFVWHDLLTPDITAIKPFYAGLFGWEYKQKAGYSVILNSGQAIGGVVEIGPKETETAVARWIASMSVSDVDMTAEWVKNQGGTVHQGPLEMLKRGRVAHISDPQGAQLLVLHSHVGDPSDSEPPVGAWLWDELWSTQPVKSVAFYRELAGYDVIDDYPGYHILSKDGMWRAGIRRVFNQQLEMRWVPSVRVADLADITRRVVPLGGQVLLEPGESPSGEDTALIADPTGALLILQRWDFEKPSAGGE